MIEFITILGTGAAVLFGAFILLIALIIAVDTVYESDEKWYHVLAIICRIWWLLLLSFVIGTIVVSMQAA